MRRRGARGAQARAVGRRKNRSRPIPKWLKGSSPSPEGIARRRCVLLLSVLSGEKPVSDAIVEAGISRPGYYQMETRALNAMLAALDPRATARKRAKAEPTAVRIAKLLKRIRELEQDKRRMSRLLRLTSRVVQPTWGLLRARRAQLRKRMRLGWTSSGEPRSSVSAQNEATRPTSTPMKAGEDGR